MGGATASIGLLPGYETIGMLAPILLIAIRILQGLALGGEYGGAAVYVAEHVPDAKRGFYTSFIQITATAGLFVSLGVILVTQSALGEEAFKDWGWRIPFLASIILVGISLYIRLRMKESPIFKHLKAQGPHIEEPAARRRSPPRRTAGACTSRSSAPPPARVSSGTRASSTRSSTCRRCWGSRPRTANIIVAVALLMAVPLFVVVGSWSDRIGRKRIMLWGMVIAAVSYLPIYKLMQIAAGNDIVGVGSTQNPVTKEYKLLPQTMVDGVEVPFTNTAFVPSGGGIAALIGLVFIQVVFVTLVYGPIAAYLVEAFPARVRYTSMSLPYHIGNGVFGGMLPVIGLTICAWTGSMYAGLAYPIVIALMTAFIGSQRLPETRAVRIWDEVEDAGSGDGAAGDIDLRGDGSKAAAGAAAPDGREPAEDTTPAPGS